MTGLVTQLSQMNWPSPTTAKESALHGHVNMFFLSPVSLSVGQYSQSHNIINHIINNHITTANFVNGVSGPLIGGINSHTHRICHWRDLIMILVTQTVIILYKI